MSLSDGPSTDLKNDPVIDPTKNVDNLVAATMKRFDDLRTSDKELQDAKMRRQDDLRQMSHNHLEAVAALRAHYDEQLDFKEAARIDAIGATKEAQLARATEVATAQATALAATVAASAEAMRNQVAAAAQAAAAATAAATTTSQAALTNALEPIVKTLADLSQKQYEAQGQSTQRMETKNASAEGQAAIVAAAIAAQLTPILTPIQATLAQVVAAQSAQSGAHGQQIESRVGNQYVITLMISLAFLSIAFIGYIVTHK